MAANSLNRGLLGFGKRFVCQIRTGSYRDPSHSPSLLSTRRAVNVSAYDKNVDDQVRPTVVPDDVIQPQSNKYWSPHPQTGVFGPSTDHNQATVKEPVKGGEDSVLEQKVFLRPSEDLDKPIEDSEKLHQP